MEHDARQSLEALMTTLLPLVSFVSGKSCEEALPVLTVLLREALETQEASSKRAAELKSMKAKDLLSLLTPQRGVREAFASAFVSEAGATPTKKSTREEKQPMQPMQPKQAKQAKHATHPRRESGEKEPKEKRERRPADKVIHGAEGSGEEEESERKKPKKVRKNSPKVAGGAWNGEEFPRITKVVKCQGDGLDFRMDVYAKKSGRGHWVETSYSLDSLDLSKVDRISQANKEIVAESCRKALTQQYGMRWPDQVKSALAATTWGKGIVPGDDNDILDFGIAGGAGGAGNAGNAEVADNLSLGEGANSE